MCTSSCPTQLVINSLCASKTACFTSLCSTFAVRRFSLLSLFTTSLAPIPSVGTGASVGAGAGAGAGAAGGTGSERGGGGGSDAIDPLAGGCGRELFGSGFRRRAGAGAGGATTSGLRGERPELAEAGGSAALRQTTAASVVPLQAERAFSS